MTSKAILPMGLVKKILEGIKVRRTTYSSDDELAKARTRAGEANCKVLGEGAYSLVIEHPSHPDKVIKFTLSTKDGYHKYVEWIQRNKDLLPRNKQKHLPVIYKSVMVGMARVTVLEKLRRRALSHEGETYTFRQVLDAVTQLSETLDLNDDIGSNNVMIRRGGTAVITDPWSHSTGK